MAFVHFWLVHDPNSGGLAVNLAVCFSELHKKLIDREV
jgi:hypothetical protein